MTDEYNLTWEQADALMHMGAIVKTGYLVPFRVKNGGYQGIFCGEWRYTTVSHVEEKSLYKIYSIPGCEDNYKEITDFKHLYYCERCNQVGLKNILRGFCIDNFMKRLCPFKNEEPKMSEELMSFDEAVVFMINNPSVNLYIKSDRGEKHHFCYNEGHGNFYESPYPRMGYVTRIENYKHLKFSKTPIKIEPKANGLGLC
jgi:hypothetical protein